MLIHVDTRSGVPVYRQIMEQIEELIFTGGLSEGEQLTSVRELSKQLSVNPMTVSKAYAFLERDNLLERQRGIGLFIAPQPKVRRKEVEQRLLLPLAEKLVFRAKQLGIEKAKIYALLDEKW